MRDITGQIILLYLVNPLTSSQTDGSGKLGLTEFHVLWEKVKRYLVRWRCFCFCWNKCLIGFKYAGKNWSLHIFCARRLNSLNPIQIKRIALHCPLTNSVSCPLVCLQSIFREHDLDKSGTMSSYEMRKALDSAGTRPEILCCSLFVSTDSFVGW